MSVRKRATKRVKSVMLTDDNTKATKVKGKGKDKGKAKIRELSAMKDNTSNPRKISPAKLEALKESLREFGDLSGVIFNKTTGNLVGGHQRMKYLRSNGDDAVITKEYSQPTQSGTTAEGYITANGDNYTYREVEWEVEKENIAMISANKHGGDWDNDILTELLASLPEEEVSLSGFSSLDVDKMVNKEKDTSQHEIIPEMLENYDYVVILTKTETEKAALHSLLKIDKVKSLESKAKAIGVGRVVSFDKFKTNMDKAYGQ